MHNSEDYPGPLSASFREKKNLRDFSDGGRLGADYLAVKNMHNVLNHQYAAKGSRPNDGGRGMMLV